MVSIHSGVFGDLQEGPKEYARNGPPPTLFVSGKMPNKSMLIDYKPRGIYTSKFGIVR